MNPAKPLGHRAYGSIGHLPGSRLGPGDHSIHEGQARIACVEVRDRHDLVLVQQKADGSNVAVAKIRGKIYALTRSGYPAHTSPHQQHQYFAKWVALESDRFDALLEDGERLCGEWLLQAHATKYEMSHEPFVAFDLMVGHKRLPYEVFRTRVEEAFVIPQLVHQGGSITIEEAFSRLDPDYHGAIDPIEGAVWRIERHGEVDFLCKAIKPEKQDGVYLESVSGGPPVWNSVRTTWALKYEPGLSDTSGKTEIAGSGRVP